MAELFEKFAVHHIRRVQPQTVNAKFVNPEADRIEQILHDLGVLQIQLDQIIVACPALIPKRIAVGTAAVKVQVLEPAAVGGVPLLLLHILKCEEFSADVVEHAVQNDADAVFAQHGADFLKGSVVAETAVDAAVVDGVVAVAAALKHRIKQNDIYAELLKMRHAVENLVQTVGLHMIVLLGSAAVTERINVVNNRFVNKTHMIILPAPVFSGARNSITQKFLLCNS